MGYVLTTTQELKHRAEEVARRLGQAKYETHSFESGSTTVNGWMASGLPPVKKDANYTVCRLILSDTGELYLQHQTTPRRKEDAVSVIDPVPVEKAAAMTNQSLQTLFSRVGHLLTDAGLRD
jgi:hypothetical protein